MAFLQVFHVRLKPKRHQPQRARVVLRRQANGPAIAPYYVNRLAGGKVRAYIPRRARPGRKRFPGLAASSAPQEMSPAARMSPAYRLSSSRPSMFPLPLATFFCTMAASETGQSAHSYRWCSRPDYDRGSDAPWLARAPAWTRRDARHWSPTLAHCYPVQSRLRRPPVQDIGNRYAPRIAFHDEGDGGRLYPKKAAPQHRHTAHRTTHFSGEDLAQRFLLQPGPPAHRHTRPQSNHRPGTLPGPGKEITRTVVNRRGWSGHTSRPQHGKRAQHRSAHARVGP